VQLGLEAEHQPAPAHMTGECIDATPQDSLGDVELPGGDPRQPAAQRLGRDAHGPARVLEHLDRRAADGRVEMVGERVGPEDDLAAPAGRPLASRGPPLQRLIGEAGQRPVLQPGGGGDQPPGARALREHVGEWGQTETPHGLGGRGQRPEGVGMAGTEPAGVVVGEELGLVRRHVDVDRAVAATALAGETEVERVVHRLRAPAVADGAVAVAVEHLEQQAGAAARGVLLLPGDPIGGAHHGAVARVLAAFADAHASGRGADEGPVVVGVGEVRRAEVHRLPVAAEPQLGVERIRVDHLARIHPPIGVEDRLQALESLDQALAEHDWKELAAGLPVAVLARQRPPIADAVPAVVGHEPIALEGMDERLVRDQQIKHEHADAIAQLPDGEGWLLVQFGGETVEEADDRARRMLDDLKLDGDRVRFLDDPEREDELWQAREAGLGATAHVPGHRETWEGWEDSAVPPEQLGDYLRDLEALYERSASPTTPSLYGHFGQGCVHTRIPFDLYTSATLG
jgi:FAD-dependent oxidoreductase family protein